MFDLMCKVNAGSPGPITIANIITFDLIIANLILFDLKMGCGKVNTGNPSPITIANIKS